MSPTLTPSKERLNFQLHRDVGVLVAFELRLDVRDRRHAESPVVALCYRHLRANESLGPCHCAAALALAPCFVLS